MNYSPLFSLEGSDLHSEAEVETRLLLTLFEDLGYPRSAVIPKGSVPRLSAQEGSARTNLRVDFLLTDEDGVPRVVVEAKAPTQSVDQAWGQAASYALSHNRDKPRGERVEWLLISNGFLTCLYAHDSDRPMVTLQLRDFASGSPPYVALRGYIKYKRTQQPGPASALPFNDIRPGELNDLFKECHDLVWRKEKMAPVDAFFEFCKFIFLKIREDRKRQDAGNLAPHQLPLTLAWLEANRATTPHPVRDLLFVQLRDDLESAVRNQTKRRIYDGQEPYRLSAETTKELIKRFESVNLSSLDEDLNGRMFEVFLNAAVRGKALGQFFTPRPLVDFMTRIGLYGVDVSLSPPRVIDACAGTAGFLIEVMAYALAAIRNDKRLLAGEKEDAAERIRSTSLFGVEANERVARIARINMYLHGDGGSHIFRADGLDSDPRTTEDMDEEHRLEVNHLRENVRPDAFDLVLTNPPFSMTYRRDNDDERRIIDTLGVLSSEHTVKSNVLFLRRYADLLRPGGQILIVVDDTILNGKSLLSVRRWLLETFFVLGVHSLPFNAFFKADANIKTSVLHLQKKAAPSEEQEKHIFMSISNNIGHDNSLRDTPERNNLNDILSYYVEWRRKGDLTPVVKLNQDRRENLECPEQIWIVSPSEVSPERLDAFAYCPELARVRMVIKRMAEAGDIKLYRGRDVPVVPKVSRSERARLKESGEVLRYFEIGHVTPYGLIVHYVSGSISELPTRAEYRVTKGDLLLAVNNSSRGTVVLVPPEFDGALCTSGFLVLRPKSEEEGLLLWYALRSELCRTQIYYLAQTASQPELKFETWQRDFLIPVPSGDSAVSALREARELQEHIHALLRADEVRLAATPDSDDEQQPSTKTDRADSGH